MFGKWLTKLGAVLAAVPLAWKAIGAVLAPIGVHLPPIPDDWFQALIGGGGATMGLGIRRGVAKVEKKTGAENIKL